eukprot:6465851-Amphidinium_carterae.1
MNIEERIEKLTAATQELHKKLRVAEQRGTEQQARAEAAEQRAASAERRSGDQQPRLVDTKTFGKLIVFSGAREQCTTWSFSFQSFLAGATPSVLDAMKWSEQQLGPIPNAPSTDPEHQRHYPHSRQLYLALGVQLGDGSDAQ